MQKLFLFLYFFYILFWPQFSYGMQPDVIEKSRKAVFGISFQPMDERKHFLDRSDIKINASSFHIGNGYIVTNFHAVSSELLGIHDENISFIHKEITLIGYNYEQYGAVLVAHDDIYDLALYRIRGAYPEDFLEFSEEELSLGEEVYTVGYPYYSKQKVGFGTVTNAEVWPATAGLRHIEIDIPVVCKGSSGGPAVNDIGKVVGIISSYIIMDSYASCAHSALAIAARYTSKIVHDFIKLGRASHAWIGVEIKYEKYKGKWHPAVGGVITDSPAEKSGLRINDIILAISEKSVRTSEDIKSIIMEHTTAGEIISIDIIREGKPHIITTIVAELEKNRSLNR